MKITGRVKGYVLSSLALAGLVFTAALGQAPQTGDAALTDAQKSEFFTARVQPILKQSCLPCHSGPSPSGGLSLANREAVLKGSANGQIVTAGKPEDSGLVHAVRYEGVKMPPQGKLPQAQIDVLTQWVTMGLPYPASAASAAAAPVKHGPPPVNAENKKFWAFQPVKRPAVPKVKNKAWVKNPIDAFVLAKLEAKKFAPAPPAAKAVLLRRAFYDVTGLPPTPAQVQAFVADKSPNAYEKVVDKLLASPQYGERWGRRWLDLVRYAETNSFERDGDKPFVWRYRDYVIKSFNEDKPYTQFVKEQLAGDELAHPTPETIIATGYYRLGLWDDEPADREQARFDEIDDYVATTGQTFLGLTVNCARCHDHKIDPIPQKDYYQLASFFRNIKRYGDGGVNKASLTPISPPAEQKRFAAESAVYQKKLDDVDTRMKAIVDTVRDGFLDVEKEDFKYEQNRIPILKKRVPDKLTQAQFDEYVAATDERKKLAAAPPRGLEEALSVTEYGPVPEKTFIMQRGNPHVPGDEVKPGFLSILSPPPAVVPAPKAGAATSGRRAVLADWIASPRNPLTARVMANRLWQGYFGRGIVRSTSNFGFLGTPPTHPELLDYLATKLVQNGWHLKPLHRQILLSNAYRMSSKANPKYLAKDPENDLLWRFDMRRLDAEEIRDSILAANGTLNKKMFGESVLVTLPKEVLAGQSVPGSGWGESSPSEQARRSVYVKIKRSLSVPMFASFDAPETDATCPVRFATTQPTQALGMMNSAFVNGQARLFADFVKKHAGPSPAAQVKLALWRVAQRPPTEAEIRRGVALIKTLRKDGDREADALTHFCVVALNTNEFIYLD